MTERAPPKNVPHTLYANVYPPFAGSCGHVYASKDLAEQMAARGRIACVPFHRGDGGIVRWRPAP